MSRVIFTRELLGELEKLYETAVSNGETAFSFQGSELLVDYAKYLIEMLRNRFSRGEAAPDGEKTARLDVLLDPTDGDKLCVTIQVGVSGESGPRYVGEFVGGLDECVGAALSAWRSMVKASSLFDMDLQTNLRCHDSISNTGRAQQFFRSVATTMQEEIDGTITSGHEMFERVH